MMNHPFEKLHEITDLFFRSLRGLSGPDDHAELNSLLNDRRLREVYRRMEDDNFVAERLRELKKYPYKPAFAKFLITRRRILRRRSLRRRIAAIGTGAAAIMIFAAAFFGRTEENHHAALDQITAGRSLAILTLDDGNSVPIGGSSAVLPAGLSGKAELSPDGELVYHAATTDEECRHNLYVPMGGEYKLRLDDGTVVWLNADTRLSYPVPFGAGERRVALCGEAYFDVTHDPDHAFVVETGSGEVRVLGTSFGLAAYPDRTGYTTLVNGTVNFACAGGEVTLSAGEQAVVTTDGQLSKRRVNVEEYVGWIDGEFIFRDKPLGEIMEILCRWYAVKVGFGDPSLAEIRYSGNLKRYESINTFLELIVRLNDLECRIDAEKIYLYR